jgi:hypothetical protein
MLARVSDTAGVALGYYPWKDGPPRRGRCVICGWQTRSPTWHGESGGIYGKRHVTASAPWLGIVVKPQRP